MGVMACDRKDCENIMCSRLILNGRMYICTDCYQELKVYKESWSEKKLPLAKIHSRIEDFMGTVPGTYVIKEDVEIDEAFEQLTGGNDDER